MRDRPNRSLDTPIRQMRRRKAAPQPPGTCLLRSIRASGRCEPLGVKFGNSAHSIAVPGSLDLARQIAKGEGAYLPRKVRGPVGARGWHREGGRSE